MASSIIKRISRKKVLFMPEEENMFQRTFSVYDLIFLGVGSTLGVGIYILSGSVAKDVTGPGIILSFLIAAVISAIAGLCFAELGACSPSSGSIYSYCYVTLGEFMAFLMGWNLLAEYIIGTASVVKALSVYIDSYLNNTIQTHLRELYEIDVPYFSQYFDAVAFLICIGFAVILTFGLKESVLINNILTSLNIVLVLFFIVIGLSKVDFANWSIPESEVPPNAGKGGFLPYGLEGVIQGAGICFYGFVGFDVIATTGAEVKNPERTLPLAIVITLAIIFLAYFGISTTLTLLVPYYLQDKTAPLSYAFKYVGYEWAQWIINVGSFFGLIACLFGAFYPISRILFAMADDGLIFRSLAKINPTYNTPVRGTLVSGIITGLTAAVLDVDQLISLNSIGTLLAYTVMAVCVIVLRYSTHAEKNSSESKPLLYNNDQKNYLQESCFHKKDVSDIKANHTVSWSIGLFCLLSVLLGIMFTEDLHHEYVTICMVVVVFLMVFIVLVIQWQPARTDLKYAPFQMPMVPSLPALSICFNIILMVQFSLYTWIRFIFVIAVGFVIYFTYGIFRNTERVQRPTR